MLELILQQRRSSQPSTSSIKLSSPLHSPFLAFKGKHIETLFGGMISTSMAVPCTCMTGLHRFSLLVWWVYSQGQTITLRSLSFLNLPSGRIPHLGLLYDSILSRARRSVSSVQVRVHLWFSDLGSLRSGFQFSVEHALSSLTVSPYAVQKVWTKLQYYQHQQSFLESRAQSPDTRFVPTATDVWYSLRCVSAVAFYRWLGA